MGLGLGQDANWDLRNYHLYNGYAWWHGRLLHDLAPAQLQSYFNPALDIVQYALMTQWPAPLTGMLMGALHAAVFLPAAAIAWYVLEGNRQRARLVPLLSLTGLCSAAFLSEFANTMADATTALPVLGALAVVMRAQRCQAAGAGPATRDWLWAGLLLGLAVACKLTNATYALAMAAAALSAGGRPRARLLGLTAMTLAALAVFGLIAGPWYLRIWEQFGNPLFPQFNAYFHAPLAQPISAGDTRWLPRNVGEWLAWPLVFTFNPWRVSEIALFQCIWALLYLAVLAIAARALLRKSLPAPDWSAQARTLLIFVGAGYLLWQAAFSIHRYLLALEVVAPLALWLCCQRVFAAPQAPWMGGGLVAFSALIALGGWNDWGRESWAWRSFRVEQPGIAQPAAATVLLVGDEPQAWRVALLPAQTRYVGVATNLPASDAYRDRVRALLAERPQHYAMLGAVMDKQVPRIQRMNRWAQRFGLSAQPDCTGLRWLVGHGLRAELDTTQPGQCMLRVLRQKAEVVEAANRQLRDTARQQLLSYGVSLDPANCRTLSSQIGQGFYPYQFCEVGLVSSAPAQGS
ncbi:hypothetical protein [Xanthomonas melonis]|uniref:hypothetical protein n=1 Tax=Xanthomonas melonis TaxID=56456 RepID=UPI001E38A778|nr:hypothetical protein [Xanthomonas melonis]MCC4601452.1 hypothetical protein [Xanthomonas melonis]